MASLPCSERPDVSIVMPVYNKLDLTRACVASLYEHAVAATWELIVVDNGSSDGSADWLAEQDTEGRLHHLANPENRGFAQGCNLGAESANGRYVLFLNNDMEVTPGWLDPLVATLDRDPEVGIVGSRLLYPDGTIQHAGVALVENRQGATPTLEGIHAAQGKPADARSAARPQVMQIVTGACLLIRREILDLTGGFDEAYWNGNEDVDLCLKTGELGWQTVYRPESVVIHYESQSGPERWAQVQANVDRLNGTWQGRAKPDLIRQADGAISRPEPCRIRNYIDPRLHLARSTPTGPLRNADAHPTASVIVLTWNALEYTRLCAESLLAYTDLRHELIFVDNGSRPDTIAFLEDLAAHHENVRVILNGENLGFAAGNNVGIAAARGDYVCLLNSDTVVTEDWLERLITAAEADPKVGLVGPVTNSITGNQRLSRTGYDENSLQGLDAFAAKRAVKEARRTEQALWIVGFCMLIRKDLIERIGGLDEGFGQGNYEDTDYCLRAFLAGYHSIVAKDCFVHHFGSRSFVEGRVDYATQIDEKFEIFRRKWHLDPSVRVTGNLNLEFLVTLGFLPPLHFHPLPESPLVQVHPVGPWELDRWLSRGEVLFQADLLAQATDLFAAIVARFPGCSRAENDLACTLWQAAKAQTDAGIAGKMLATAVASLESLLSREPDNEDARWNLQEISKSLSEVGVDAQETKAPTRETITPA